MIEQHADVEAIFDRAVEIDSLEQQQAYLGEACGNDRHLRTRVEALLQANVQAGSFLEKPPEAVVATVAPGQFNTVDDGDGEVSLSFLEESDKPGCLGTLGPYEILELVGRGGMGIVLRAYDTKLSRVVAIKVMAPELAANPMAVKRFLREARAAAAVTHDHVVTIHAIEEGHRPPFIVMEFLDGQSLQQKIDAEGALSLMEILRIGMQMARGLAAAHEQGLVHRDIKPANILLENGVERVKITDFGLARAVDDVGVTQTGQIAGTPQYMSPEQAQGHPFDARSDLFSLGSVLYTMCTGRAPFRAETPLAMLRRVTDDTPRSVRQVNAEVPDWLEAIIFKLLDKDPDQRFQSAAEVAELLSQHLAHIQHPTTVPQPQPIVPPVRPGIGVQPVHQTRMFGKSAGDNELASHPARRRSPRGPLFTGIACLIGATFLAAVAAIVIFVQTNYGVVRVEVLDPDTQIMLKCNRDQLLAIRDKNTTLRVRPGANSLWIKHGDLEFETDKFTVKRGEKVVVRVSRVSGNLEVRADGMLIGGGRQELPGTVAAPGSALTEVRRFGEVHTRPFADIAYLPSPEGRLIATASYDGTVRIWDVETGREAQQFLDLGNTNPKSMAASPDGKTIAVGDHAGTVYLWDVENGQFRHKLKLGTGFVYDLAFSPDGSRVYVGMAHYPKKRSGAVVVYDAVSGARLREFEGADNYGQIVAPLADGVRVLAGGQVHQGGVWDSETGHLLTRFHDLPQTPNALAASPDGTLAAIGFKVNKRRGHRWDDPDSQGIWLCDVVNGRVVRKLGGHTGNVNGLAFSADGRFLISGSGGHHARQDFVSAWDNTLRVWDVETGAEIARAAVETQWGVWSLALLPDGRHVVTASGDRGQPDLRLWRLPERVGRSDGRVATPTKTSELVEVRQFHFREISQAGFTANGESVLTLVRFDESARIVRVADGKELHRLSGRFGAAATTPDGRHIVTGTTHPSEDEPANELIVWDAESGDKRLTLGQVTGAIHDLAVAPDGRTVVSAHGQWWGDYQQRDHAIRLWDIEEGKVIHEIQDHLNQVMSVAILSDGKRFVSGSRDGTVRLWNLNSGEELGRFEGTGTEVFAVAASPDSRFILAGFGPDESTGIQGPMIDDPAHCVAVLWDSETGKEVRRFTGHHGCIKDVGFSPDGRWIVTASGGEHVGEPLPDGSAKVTRDNTVRLWNATTGRQLAVIDHPSSLHSAEFSPDGNYLVTGEGQVVHIWQVPEELNRSGDSSGASMSSADAKQRQLLISSDRGGDFDIYQIDEYGAGWQNLTDNPAQDTGPAFSPDGRKIAFCSSRSGNLDIWVMNHDGSEPRQLTIDPAIDRTPCWSPDGTKIAFVRHVSTNNWDIFVMNADGSNQMELTNHPAKEADPVWSPDGKYIAYSFENDGTRLYRMHSDGSRPRMLSPRKGAFTYPVFSPDGRTIIYTARTDKPSGDAGIGRTDLELFRADASGSRERQLTQLGGLNTFAAFSPDGQRIAFEHRGPDTPGAKAIVYVMNVDGTDLRPITGQEAHIGYGGGRPAWKPAIATRKRNREEAR